MGLIKYQKGKIAGVNTEEKTVEENRPENGHNQDMHCPHNVPVNSCKLCAGRPTTEPKPDERS